MFDVCVPLVPRCDAVRLYDNFSKRLQPYIDVVLRTQSQSGDRAQVLVAVTVKTSNAGAAQPKLRA